MESQLPSLVRMEERLHRLERQNRLFKLLVTLTVIFAAVLFVMGQAAPARKTVEANEFILKDGNGNVRARLRMGGDFWAVPQLDLLDEKGTIRLQLFGGMGRRGEVANLSGMKVFDESGLQRGMFTTDNYGAALAFINVKGSDDALVRGETISVSGPVTVSDERGFQAILGQTDLETPRSGETHRTSAASLVLFDKDKKVIWKAP